MPDILCKGNCISRITTYTRYALAIHGFTDCLKSFFKRRLYLDNCYQALISGRISGHGEPAGGVAPGDFVDSIPGRGVGLVLVSHCQVSHNDIHAVFRNLAEELHE